MQFHPEDYCKHQMRLLGKAHSTTGSHYTSIIMVVPIITIEPEEPALLTKNQGGGEGSQARLSINRDCAAVSNHSPYTCHTK